MALNLTAAKQDLQKFCDPKYSGYLGDVPDNATAIQRAIDGWADALYDCCLLVFPASATVALAKTAFQAAAVGMYASGAVFQAAVAAFALELGLGMADSVLNPPSGYTAIPPPALYLPTSVSENHAQMCEDFATELVAWLETGTATSNSPPFTTVGWT